MQIITLNHTNTSMVIQQACQVLETGGLLLFPTETVYGAGVDATNQEAVDKLLAYKSRREGKPLSIAVPDQASAEKYVELTDQARAVYQQFLPGPVTVVSRGLGQVAAGVESEFGTLGVRIPDHEFLLKLLRKYGKPITATSANASGKKRPYAVKDILDNLSEKQKSLIDLILDAGELPKNEPSTVIDTTHATPIALRSGELTGTILGKQVSDLQTITLDSSSESETKIIAGKIILKHWNAVRKSGLVIGLDGKLGAGKTVFAKGVAEFLGIDEVTGSPTYSYIEEYEFHRHDTQGKFFHLDLWKVENSQELERLELTELLRPNTVVIIEWFEPHERQLLQITHNAHSILIRVVINETARKKTARKLTIMAEE